MHARYQSSAASVHRHHELDGPAAAFLPICVVNDTGNVAQTAVGIRVKV